MFRILAPAAILVFAASSAFAIDCPQATLRCTATDLTTGKVVSSHAVPLVAQNDDEPSEPQYADHCEAFASFALGGNNPRAYYSVDASYRDSDSSIDVRAQSSICATEHTGPCVGDTEFPNDSHEYRLQPGQSFQLKLERYQVLMTCSL